ncbi:MAG: IPT/TIG domain protein [Euryarchaeota archaeon ADurb.Bin165]|nr:MAG: IPT/TIG domain protein [Euryarchaeota archaeon ADurb.Bin165]
MAVNKEFLCLFVFLIILAQFTATPVSAEMVITSFTPDTAKLGEMVDITLSGTGFKSASIFSILLMHWESSVIACKGFSIRSDTELGVKFSLGSALHGPYKIVIVTDKNEKFQSSTNFTVIYRTPPHIDNIAPDSAHLGEEPFSIQIKGEVFMPGCIVEFEGRDGVTFTSIPTKSAWDMIECSFAGNQNKGDKYLVRVKNIDTQVSQEPVYFTVLAPLPIVTGVAPENGMKGDTSFALTVTGSGFTDGCSIHLMNQNGMCISNLSETMVTNEGHEVSCYFDLSLLPVGPCRVVIENPDGQESEEEIYFTVTFPAPVVSSVNPASGLTSDTSFTLTVTGSDFTDGCSIHLMNQNGMCISNLSETMVTNEGHEVSCYFDLSLLPVGPCRVVIENPDGQESEEEIYFTVTFPAPVVSSVNPASGLTSDTSFTLTVTGSDFTDGCSIHLMNQNGMCISNLSETMVTNEGHEVSCYFDLSLLPVGPCRVVIENPDGQESEEEIYFTVTFPAPVVSSVSPASGLTSDTNFALAVTGSGFMDGCSIHLCNLTHTIFTNTSSTVTSEKGTCALSLFNLSDGSAGTYTVKVKNPDDKVSNENIHFEVKEPSEPTYVIHVTAGQGGFATPGGIVHVPCHSDLNIRIQANAGYKIQNVYLDTIPKGNLNSLLLTDITSNHNVFVDFSKINPSPVPVPTVMPTPVPTENPVFYTLNISANYGGKIRPDGTINMLKGSDVAFQIECLEDFNVAYLLVDDVPLFVNGSWVLQSVHSNHTIQLVTKRKISPYWADFNMSSSRDNNISQVMFTSDYYPDCLYEIWEYGDESTTYGRPINHSYQSHGNYTVSHKVVFKDSVAKCNHVIAIE